MIGLLLISHGKFAEGLLDATRMIIGEVDKIIAISLNENEGIANLDGKVKEAISNLDYGQGVLVLTDLFGASPCNVSTKIMLKERNINVVTGMNLPMLLETATQRKDNTLDELTKIAINSGKDGVINISNMVRRDSELF